MSDIGEGLYRLVTEYAELGDHRTGSDVDARDAFVVRSEARSSPAD